MAVEVEIKNTLSAEMQLVADCREAVKKAEAEVEHCKGELKTAKAVLEDCQEQLNNAVDAAIEAERQPHLFSGIGDDLADEPQPARVVETEPAGDGGDCGDGGDAGEVIDRIPAGEVEGVPGLVALPAAAVDTDESAPEAESDETPLESGGDEDADGPADETTKKGRGGRRKKSATGDAE